MGRSTGRTHNERDHILATWREGIQRVATYPNVVAKHSGVAFPMLGMPTGRWSRQQIVDSSAALVVPTTELCCAAPSATTPGGSTASEPGRGPDDCGGRGWPGTAAAAQLHGGVLARRDRESGRRQRRGATSGGTRGLGGGVLGLSLALVPQIAGLVWARTAWRGGHRRIGAVGMLLNGLLVVALTAFTIVTLLAA